MEFYFMDYNGLCSEILKINGKIRYAGVYNVTSGKIFEKIQKGITRYLDLEQTNNSITQAYMRWKTRQQYSDKIGDPIYAMAKYTKMNRVTMPCGDKALLLIHTEPDIEIHTIMENVLKLIEKFSDEPNFNPRKPTFNF
jgi:hypothetical protein